MPITAQQKKAIGYNQAGWRSAKHLRQAAQGARGKPGVSFLDDLSYAKKVGWVEARKPEWAKEMYYRLTKKGRTYLEKMRFKVASEAFRLGESIKLSATRSDLQRLGWYSVKHVGRVDDKWIEDGYYERATFFRQRQNGTFYRITPAGRLWAKERLRRRMEADLRESFQWERQRETAKLKEQFSQPSQLIKAWSR
jgi:DNA-binding PadR family transcriptional regulator